jgi:hypothetical protein
MLRDSTVIRLRPPDAIADPLTGVAREGARRMLAQVLIAEADAFVALWKDVKLPDGRDRVVLVWTAPSTASMCQNEVAEDLKAKETVRGTDYSNWDGYVKARVPAPWCERG